MDFVLKLIVEGLFASFAAVGFAIVFNVPKETLKYCAIGGAIAYDVRTVLLNLNLGIELSTFLASTTVGIIALYWSRVIKKKICYDYYLWSYCICSNFNCKYFPVRWH